MVKYLSEVSSSEFKQGSSVTIGSFDGVHIAHRALIKELIGNAKLRGEKSVIITFETHPRIVLEGERCNMQLLSTTLEKSTILESLGVDLVLLLKFEEIRNLTAEQFYQQILIDKLNTTTITAGYNNNIGSDRANSFSFFSSKENLNVSLINQILYNDKKVNSTRIRELLISGDICGANDLLDYDYSMDFIAESDNQTLSKCDKFKLMPHVGNYYAKINGSVVNISIKDDNIVIINKIEKPEIEYNKVYRVSFIKK